MTHDQRCRLVHVDVDLSAGDQVKRPQIIDPVGMVGVRMGHENAVDVPDVRVDQLLAQVRSGVDQTVVTPVP